ncbi:MAG TPA: type II secretion system minor pseudopilin GspK [Gammaproteobacteria bacterium]|nr:type II secretion system minor pseudopilin GspK [Gammaproteobacteria bacterium]
MALITVLLIVTVLTAIVARLSLSNEVWIRQVEGGAALAQADQVSRAAQQWVGLLLAKDTNQFDGRTEPWARPLPPLPVGWGELTGHVEDRQGRFNLNNLVTSKGKVDAGAMAKFQRLLRLLGLNPAIADAAVDWIDKNQQPHGSGGAEDAFYQGRKPPYLAANRPFADPAEVRLLRGVDGKAWQKLQPYIAALPEATGVNVNTASPQVLAAVIRSWGPPRLALAKAKKWAKRTDKQPFTKTDQARRAMGISGTQGTGTGLTVMTNYFLVHTRASFGDVSRSFATLYRRSGSKVEIVRHSTEIR